MTANRGLFVRNSGSTGTTPIEGRLVLASLVAENAPGVPRQGLLDQKTTTLVSGSATDMSYNVAPCIPVLNRATNEGVYIFTLTGTTNIATDAAPVTGSRWDLVYVKQNDPDKGDTGNTAVLGVVKGTAAASPVKPTANLPTGAYVLAEVLVNSGAANAAAAGVTITQVWRYTALRGVAVPVRSQAERDEITPTLGARVARLDMHALGKYTERYDGTAWSPDGELKPFGHMGKNNGFQNLNGTVTTITMQVASNLRGGVTFDAANNSLVVPLTGLYRVTAQCYFSGAMAGNNIAVIYKNANQTGIGYRAVPVSSDMVGNCAGVVSASAGDKFYLAQQSGSGGQQAWGSDGYNGSWLQVEYIGPA